MFGLFSFGTKYLLCSRRKILNQRLHDLRRIRGTCKYICYCCIIPIFFFFVCWCDENLFYWQNSYSFGRKLQTLSAHIIVMEEIRHFTCARLSLTYDIRPTQIHLVYGVYVIFRIFRFFIWMFVGSVVLWKSFGNEITMAWIWKGANVLKINNHTGNLKYLLIFLFDAPHCIKISICPYKKTHRVKNWIDKSC